MLRSVRATGISLLALVAIVCVMAIGGSSAQANGHGCGTVVVTFNGDGGVNRFTVHVTRVTHMTCTQAASVVRLDLMGPQRRGFYCHSGYRRNGQFPLRCSNGRRSFASVVRGP